MDSYVRDTTLEDLPILAATLRPSDTAEILAASGRSNLEALTIGLSGEVCKTVCLSDGTPVAIYGTNPTLTDGLGSIWMVATVDFHKMHMQFLKEGKGYVQDLSKGYKTLFNYTDARNALHHRWLKWCGFVFINKHENYGKNGEAFFEFVRITE